MNAGTHMQPAIIRILRPRPTVRRVYDSGMTCPTVYDSAHASRLSYIVRQCPTVSDSLTWDCCRTVGLLSDFCRTLLSDCYTGALAQISLHGLSLGFTSPDLTALSPPHPPGRGVGGVECVRKAQAPVRPPPRTPGGARGRHATHTKVDCARAKFNRFKPFFQCALARWP